MRRSGNGEPGCPHAVAAILFLVEFVVEEEMAITDDVNFRGLFAPETCTCQEKAALRRISDNGKFVSHALRT